MFVFLMILSITHFYFKKPVAPVSISQLATSFISAFAYPLPATTEKTITLQQKHRLGSIQRTNRDTNQSKDTIKNSSLTGRCSLQINNRDTTSSLASHTVPKETTLPT
jgi:hypothetical protein